MVTACRWRSSRFTSQTCATCRVVGATTRWSQAPFVCVSCGRTAHAVINASVNITRRWNTPLQEVEGLHRHTRGASTGRGLAISEGPRCSRQGRC
ncbi:zinc ribbon domain-containing protein [Methylobacterium hispanicum]|uniref:zinc ribbon domain-containing protein n=1 Tax=Methylobacterium hispanicum TaxID=270350 RepID=UPI003570CC6F